MSAEFRKQELADANGRAVARFPVSVLLPRFQLVSTDSSCHKMSFNCG